MSTPAIIVNVIMSVLVLGGIGLGFVVAAGLRVSGDEGRASGRGPLHAWAPL
jgi:hypothetical protein